MRALSKRFGARRVVSNVDLEVKQGEAVGLLGPNGAGKTSCFHMICGLMRGDSGRVLLDGRDVMDLPLYQRARLGIGYLPQEESVFRQLRTDENILAALEASEPDKARRRQICASLLAEFGLEPVAHSQASLLSGGERRRLEIARALALSPRYILLDEPFAGIDPKTAGEIRKWVADLKKRAIGVLVTDHNVYETLALVDRAYILYEGQILACGTAAEIAENPAVQQVYLGESFRLDMAGSASAKRPEESPEEKESPPA